jgi:hypothetical protein
LQVKELEKPLRHAGFCDGEAKKPAICSRSGMASAHPNRLRRCCGWISLSPANDEESQYGEESSDSGNDHAEASRSGGR